MKKILLVSLALSCLFSFAGFAQDQHVIDSLETLLKKRNTEKAELRNNRSSLNDTTIVNLLFELWKNYRANSPDKARECALQGITLSEQIGFKRGAGMAYNNLGVIYYMKRDFAQAIDTYKKSLKIRKEINDKKGIAATYNNIGNVQFAQGNYPLALENYLISLKIKEEINDRQGIADANVNLGNVYQAQNNFKEALKYYLICLKMNQESGDKEGLENIYINIGALYIVQGNTSEAAKAYNSALKIAEEIGDKNIMSDCYNNLGTVYFYADNPKEQMKSYEAALKLKEELGDKSGIATVYINMASIYTKQKKYKEASDILNKALSISKEIKSFTTIFECYNFLAALDSAQGNYEEGFEHLKLLMESRDSLVNDEKTKKIIALQLQYDFDKKEAAIKAVQDVKDAVAKQKHQQVIVSLVMGVLILTVIMLLFINRRKAKHDLQVNKLENKTLRSQLNPHFIFNALASIQKYMNENPERAENYLAKFGKLMREVLENSEKEYIPLADEFAMLKKYMDLEALRVAHGFDYEFIIDPSIDEEEVQIPPLIFQPVIENAIWHGVANAKSKGKIFIYVAIQNAMLKIEVMNENNEPLIEKTTINEGFEKKKSFGLQIVRERLVLLSKDKKGKANLQLFPQTNGMKVLMELPT